MGLIDILIISIGCIFCVVCFTIALILFFNAVPYLEYLIVCTVAEKGAGKTTLNCALADLFHRRYEPLVRAEIQPVIDEGKANGFENIDLPQDTLVYSDTDLCTCVDSKHRDEYIKAYKCDINKFRVPTENNYKDIDRYPFGSYLIFDEIANKAQSRDFANFSKNLPAMLNLTRKFFYNVNFIWPDFMATDKLIRNSCHILRYVKGCRMETDKKGRIVGMTWWFIDYFGAKKVENFNAGVEPAGAYEPFVMFTPKHKDIAKYYYTYKGDISKICKTRRELMYMLLHFVKWTLNKEPDYRITRKDVKDFCKNNPVFADNFADLLDKVSIAEKRKGVLKRSFDEK
jgi:hypothetical protein